MAEAAAVLSASCNGIHLSPGGRPSGARAARAAGGLVFSSTSDTRPARTDVLPFVRSVISGRFADAVECDPNAGRIRRMRRTVLNSARLFGALDSVPRRGVRARWWLVTLTLAPGAQLKPKDVSDAIKCCREWMRRCAKWWIQAQQFVYAWTLELMQNGSPHYHLLFKLPRHLEMPHWDSRGWWKHGMSNVKRAKHAFGYIAKYVSKGGTEGPGGHRVPKGFRLFGVGGLTKAQRPEVRWWNAPKWAQDAFGWGADIRPGPTGIGGRVNALTGELLASPWIVLHVCGRLFLLPKKAS